MKVEQQFKVKKNELEIYSENWYSAITKYNINLQYEL